MATSRNRFFLRHFNQQNFVAVILVALGCLTSSLTGCRNDSAAEKLNLANTAPIKVNVFQPKRVENATQTSSFFGKLIANRSQTLGFPVGGSLATAPEAEQRFASGATLATLDSTQLTEQLEKLEQQAEASPPGGINNPNTRSPQNQIPELQSQIAQRTIKAPFDCIVQSTFAQRDSLVGANRPVVSVVETTTPKIEIILPRRTVKQIRDDREYTFLLDGKEIQATVRERAFSENPPGNVRLVFDIKTDLNDFEFYLNETVEARFSFSSEQAGYWLPMSCLQQANDGEWFVLAIESDDQQHNIRRQVVQIAQLRDDAVLVTDDLSEQMIVRDGVHRVVPGQQVELEKVELESDATDSPESAVTVDSESTP